MEILNCSFLKKGKARGDLRAEREEGLSDGLELRMGGCHPSACWPVYPSPTYPRPFRH